MTENSYPEIKSFVRHHGRLTPGQLKALTEYWGKYGVDYTAETMDSECFEQFEKVVFEIGFGNGESFIQMAKSSPQTLFIGVEVHRPGVGRALMLAQENQLNNVLIFEHDGVEVIKHMLPKNSIDRIQVYFPDPWHKKRHTKRRLIQKPLCLLFHQALKTEGILHIATDWTPYAEHCLAVINPMPEFKNLSDTQGFVEKPDYRPETKFERRGLKLGHKVSDLRFKKV